MPLTNTSTGELVTAAWLNAIVDRINSMLVSVTGGIWTGTVQKVAQSFRGLHLRTHPNALAAPSQVALLGVDEVVMSDGTRYLPPKSIFPLVADVSTTGLGGLDAGVEANGAWYDIYLVGKSSTGSTSDLRLMLHLSTLHLLNQQQITFTTNSPLRFGPTTHIKLAQSFQISSTGQVPFIDISIFRAASPTGTIWLTLEASSGGTPSGTPLATSDKLDASGVSGVGMQWVRFPFRKPATLTSGTQYFVVLQGDYATNGTAYVAWNYFGSGNLYTDGQFFTYNGSAWSSTFTADQTFRIYVTGADTAIVLPSGYDQSLKIGYVYNTTSGNFSAFDAIDRDVKRLTSGGTSNQWCGTTSAVPTLFDLYALLPPCPVIMKNEGHNTATNGIIGAAGVPDGYWAGPNIGDGGQAYVNTAVGGYNMAIPDIHTEYQAVYSYASIGTSNICLIGWEWLS